MLASRTTHHQKPTHTRVPSSSSPTPPRFCRAHSSFLYSVARPSSPPRRSPTTPLTPPPHRRAGSAFARLMSAAATFSSRPTPPAPQLDGRPARPLHLRRRRLHPRVSVLNTHETRAIHAPTAAKRRTSKAIVPPHQDHPAQCLAPVARPRSQQASDPSEKADELALQDERVAERCSPPPPPGRAGHRPPVLEPVFDQGRAAVADAQRPTTAGTAPAPTVHEASSIRLRSVVEEDALAPNLLQRLPALRL